MHPSTISAKESQFADKLVAGVVKYSIDSTTELPDGYRITSIRPPTLTYFYPTETEKTSICLHFTVGHIMSDIPALTNPTSHVSVAYVVDRAGRIYELFPDRYWSYHLGSGAIGGNATMSKHSIGIEISNYGPLTLKDGKLLDAYGNTYCSESETDLYDRHDYRGYQYYASMTAEQVGATAALVKHLCSTHNIPANFRQDDRPFASTAEAISFRGIFYHTSVRKDKFDWPFSPSLSAVVEACQEPVPVIEPTETVEPDAPEEHPDMTPETPVEPVQCTPDIAITEKPAGTETDRPSGKSWLARLFETLASLFRKH